MIYLTCGTPGSGKTLHTISTVEQRRIKENRKVFYNGIDGLSLEWEQLDDATQWDTLPVGSIIVIDECQRLLPIRKQSAQVPPHVSAFETHRHKGYDIYLITQSPQLLDMHVRKLVGEYKFVDRPYNQDYAVVWKFRHVCDWKNTTERAAAEQIRWKYPKEAFNWYKSAEVHTHKKRFPKFLLWFPALFFLIAFCGYALYSVFNKYKEAKNEAPQAQLQSNSMATATFNSLGNQAYFSGIQAPEENKLLSTAEYLAMRVPRLPELPYSAPVYDQLAQPTNFPKVSACVVGKDDCQCWTQQATRLHIDKQFCVYFVENGYFDPFLAPSEPPQQKPTHPDTPETLTARSTAPVPQPQSPFASPQHPL
ncbi:MAG: zonular occludens toxin domain-containing protein [Burkholderiales bacterium]|jgi:hypothetical protein|nr:zonular occludens toxin domain-containing protein [Burkholderiales bacterium]